MFTSPLCLDDGHTQHGLKTEVTAVARPDVNLGAVKNLAKNLGASFRSRQYFF